MIYYIFFLIFISVTWYFICLYYEQKEFEKFVKDNEKQIKEKNDLLKKMAREHVEFINLLVIQSKND